MSERKPKELLNQLESLLDSDPLIDEVGFVHPSQFVTLDDDFLILQDIPSERAFWCRDHKLAISTDVLFPLYVEAKDAFAAILESCKDKSCSSFSICVLETEIMRHSKALLLLSCDFGTAWNFRKVILSKDENRQRLIDELLFSSMVLSCAPKSEHSWSHRRWVIKMFAAKFSNLQEIVEKESDFVGHIVETSKMNYRAWNHRCWLVSFMSRRQVLYELDKSKKWTRLHIADNSAFHYRTRLLLRLLDNSRQDQDLDASPGIEAETRHIWREELDWNRMLIEKFVGREALWLHRRFLSLGWVRHFATEDCALLRNADHRATMDYETDAFLCNELAFFRACSTILDNAFDDFQAQAIFSSTYILWLAKQLPENMAFGLEEKLGEVKKVMECVCPEKIFLWRSSCGNIHERVE